MTERPEITVVYWSFAVTVAVTLEPAFTLFDESVKVEFVALGVVSPLTVSDFVAVIAVAVTVAVIVRVIASCGEIVQVTTPEASVVVPQDEGKVPVSAPPV